MLNNLSSASPTALLIAGAIFVAVVARQLQARRLRPAGLAAVPAVLLLFGLQDAPLLAGLDGAQALLLGVSLLGGAVLGAARGLTFRTWVDATGQAWSRGTWLTLVLWAGLIVFRIAAGAAGHLAGGSTQMMTVEIVLTVAFNFAAQNAVLWLRRPAQAAMARA